MAKDNLPSVPDEFNFNAGITGQVFDLRNSDYIKSQPAKTHPALIKKAKKYVNIEAAKNIPYQTIYKSKKSGGSVEVHPLTYDEKDFNELKNNAIVFANKGDTIRIIPDVKEKELREAILPEEVVSQSRTPDYWINDNMTADLKKVEGATKNSIKRPFSTVKGQSENVIVFIPDSYPFTEDEVIKMINNKMSMDECKEINEVWVNYKGNGFKNPHKK